MTMRRDVRLEIKERQLSSEGSETYVFGFAGVRQKAPATSGVYTIYSPTRWIYIGESDDIQRSLFRHLNEPTPCMSRFGPLSFSFVLGNEIERKAERRALAAALAPVCNEAGAQS